MQGQGIDTKCVRLYQNNKSTILLKNNGKMSSSKHTKHVKAKFFFITNKVEQGEIIVEHLPTDSMWINVNTKPKQGGPFRVDRSNIMNSPIDVVDETVMHENFTPTYYFYAVNNGYQITHRTSDAVPSPACRSVLEIVRSLMIQMSVRGCKLWRCREM